MGMKGSKEAKLTIERQPAQVQPLLQIAPLPKKQDKQKARRDLRIHPEIYPIPVVETAVSLIDPRNFEISWDPGQDMEHTWVHISAKGAEHDAEELEYYFYRKLILASATHHSQQIHSDIRRLFMQTAHNVTRQTWQALGWNDAFTSSPAEVEEVAGVSKTLQPQAYNNISYVIDNANQRLLLYIETEVYGLPDVLSTASEMRRSGWEVKVEAHVKPIQVVVTLKNDDIMSAIRQFYNALNAVNASVSDSVSDSKNDEIESMHEQVVDTDIQRIDIEVYPQIFPLSTIQLAALLVLGRFHIKIHGNPAQRIRVSLKPKSIVDGSRAEGVFYEALIQASLDEYKLAYYGPIRTYFLKLALSFGAELEDTPLSSYFQTHDHKDQKLDYRIWIDNSEICVSISGGESERIKLLAVAWRLKNKGVFVFEPDGTYGICLKVRPKGHTRVTELTTALNCELQRCHAFC